MRPRDVAISAFGLGCVAFVVNFAAGVDDRCSDSGWSGCGWIWELSGLVVLGAAAVVLVAVAVAVLSRRRLG